MMNADLIFVGVDVSKASLDTCVGVGGSILQSAASSKGHVLFSSCSSLLLVRTVDTTADSLNLASESTCGVGET